jgi:hypothetical protein
VEEALEIAAEIGRFPLIIRPAFTLGGTGGGIAYNLDEFKQIVATGIDASMTDQVGGWVGVTDWLLRVAVTQAGGLHSGRWLLFGLLTNHHDVAPCPDRSPVHLQPRVHTSLLSHSLLTPPGPCCSPVQPSTCNSHLPPHTHSPCPSYTPPLPMPGPGGAVAHRLEGV